MLLRFTLLLALVLGAAACGGGDDGPTESEFQRAAGAACTKANAALMSTRLPRSESEERAFDDRLARARDARWVALRDVEAPASLRKRFQRVVAQRDWSGLGELRLAHCTAEGVAAFRGGEGWIDRVEPVCDAAMDELTAEKAMGYAERTRDTARRVRRVARAMADAPPPAEAAPAHDAAVSSLRATARFLDRVAAGRAQFDVLDLHGSFIRGAAALDLLDAGTCGDVYPQLTGESAG